MRCTECSNIVRPVVALDIDGVLGEYHQHLLDFMDGYFGESFPRNWEGFGDWETYLGLTRYDYHEVKLAFRQGGMKRTMPVRNGAFDLAWQATTHGAEVWITTTRPWNRLDSVDPDTKEWLHRHSIYYDHLLYDEHKYDRLAQIVDPLRVCFVLDDLPEMYAEANRNFRGRVYLLDRPHNSWTKTGESNFGNGEKYQRASTLVAAQNLMIQSILNWGHQ